MTVYNRNLDLGFLNKEEARVVLGVLERDKRLKETEKERIGRQLEWRGDGQSLNGISPLGWKEIPRNQQTVKTSSVHPFQPLYSTNIGYTEQHTVRNKTMKGKDDRGAGHATLRARLSSMFSLRVPMRASRDPGGKDMSHSNNTGVGNITSDARLSCTHKHDVTKHTEEVHTEEVHTEEVHTEQHTKKQTGDPEKEEQIVEEQREDPEKKEQETTEESVTEEHMEEVIGQGASSEGQTGTKRLVKCSWADPLGPGGENERSTGQAHCRSAQREDQESSRDIGPASGPQSASHPAENHEDSTATHWKGKFIPPSVELKTSGPSISPPHRTYNSPTRTCHPDISQYSTSQQHSLSTADTVGSLSPADTVGSLSPEMTNTPFHRAHEPTVIPSSFVKKRGQFQRTSSPAAAEALHRSVVRPWSVESPGTFSVLRPSSSTILPTSHWGDAPCHPHSDHTERPITLRQHISRSHPSLFPGSPPRSLSKTNPDTTPSHSPLGYSTRLRSSLIFSSSAVSKNNSLATVTQYPKYSHSAKSYDRPRAKAVTMDTTGYNTDPYHAAPSNTRWMSSSERINILAKQHNLAAPDNSQLENLQTSSSVQHNHPKQFKHQCQSHSYDTSAILDLKTHSVPGLNPRASHLPIGSPDHVTLTRSCDNAHNVPAGTVFLRDTMKMVDSEMIDCERHNNNEHKEQTTNNGIRTFRNRKDSFGRPTQDTTIISERTEKEPTKVSKVDQILNRLRVTFGSKRLEEKSLLFGRKGWKTLPSTLRGTSDITEGRTICESREVKEVVKPIDLENNIEGCLRLQSRGGQGSHFSTKKLTPNKAQLNMLSSSSRDNHLSTDFDPEDTENEDVFHSSLAQDSTSGRKDKIAEEANSNRPKTSQLPYSSISPKYCSPSKDYGLKHGRSISVTNIYSNRTSRKRRISTGTDKSMTRDLKSMEDLRRPGDLGRPLRSQSRAFSCTLVRSTSVRQIRPQITERSLCPEGMAMYSSVVLNEPAPLPTEMSHFSCITGLTSRVNVSPREQLPSLSVFEEYDSDTTTDGEYYCSEDWEKESIL